MKTISFKEAQTKYENAEPDGLPCLGCEWDGLDHESGCPTLEPEPELDDPDEGA